MSGNVENTVIKNLVQTLPGKPGVYRYLDKEGKVIYVGKAKNLKKRVSSYFTKNHPSGKLKLLVRKIADIKFIVTDSESDALLLENNLIKKYQPRYNILLKDDKSFPWICIKNEPFPRVFPTRNPQKDGSEYYGPYTSVKMMRTLLDIIKQLYPLRTCKLDLSKKTSKKEISKCVWSITLATASGHASENSRKQTTTFPSIMYAPSSKATLTKLSRS